MKPAETTVGVILSAAEAQSVTQMVVDETYRFRVPAMETLEANGASEYALRLRHEANRAVDQGGGVLLDEPMAAFCIAQLAATARRLDRRAAFVCAALYHSPFAKSVLREAVANAGIQSAKVQAVQSDLQQQFDLSRSWWVS